MKKFIFALITASLLTACGEAPQQSAKDIQSQKAAEAANSIVRTENAEIDNIKRRLELTSSPSQIGFIVLLNQSGQPIWYGSVKGKVTSSTKRLTPPVMDWGSGPNAIPIGTLDVAPSDDGTWGSSDAYIFFWDTDGAYHQWSGQYHYSDKPFRLNIQPLLVNIKD